LAGIQGNFKGEVKEYEVCISNRTDEVAGGMVGEKGGMTGENRTKIYRQRAEAS
jgi:hypothetical protein